jgi:hypothetical protein
MVMVMVMVVVVVMVMAMQANKTNKHQLFEENAKHQKQHSGCARKEIHTVWGKENRRSRGD